MRVDEMRSTMDDDDVKVFRDAVKAKAEEECDAMAEFSDECEWCVVPTNEAAHCFPKARVFGANKTEEVCNALAKFSDECDRCECVEVQHLWP